MHRNDGRDPAGSPVSFGVNHCGLTVWDNKSMFYVRLKEGRDRQTDRQTERRMDCLGEVSLIHKD